MSIRAEAEENLRVIRSLMEKATVYRAISAPGALAGGVGSLTLALIGWIWLWHPWLSVPHPLWRFLLPWLALVVVNTAINLTLLAGDASRRGEPFVSPGMRLALRAMLPALLGGAAATSLVNVTSPVMVAALWVLLYGISLLAAAHFAPKSICWLGRAFFVAGFVLVASMPFEKFWAQAGDHTRIAHLIMGATFGLFHLIYAACVWPRKSAA